MTSIDPPSSRQRLWLAALPLALGLSACVGNIAPDASDAESGGAGDGTSGSSAGNTSGTTGGGPGTPEACQAPRPGPAPLRRLSNAEYRNSVSDLFASVPGIEELVIEATRDFPAESESLGFRNSAELLTVQPLQAQNYMAAAERVAALVASSDGAVPCDPEQDGAAECGGSFIADLGHRVYRRPLTGQEQARYQAQFEAALAEYDFETGVEWVTFTMLQSPQFIHRVEFGEPEATDGVTRPTPFEMASRLSFLFWQSTPDERLLGVAEETGLDTPEEVETLAREMLEDPRSRRVFQFFAEWLDLDELNAFDRDAEIFGELPSELPRWFEDETRHLVEDLLARPDGSLSELFTAPYTYLNAGLAEHYGLSTPAENGFVRVDVSDRSGVLTQAMLLVHDKPYRTSIVRRGLKVRTDLLCQNVPAPPDDVPLDIDGADSDLSQRERLEQHRSEPLCAGCHEALDPIGLALESFDAVGRIRTEDEAGDPIDTSSELTGTRDADGPISGARELGQRLAESSEAAECYVTQNFRFFFGREVEAVDACSMASLNQAFGGTNQSLSELLVALTQTDAFLYRPVISEEQP